MRCPRAGVAAWIAPWHPLTPEQPMCTLPNTKGVKVAMRLYSLSFGTKQRLATNCLVLVKI